MFIGVLGPHVSGVAALLYSKAKFLIKGTSMLWFREKFTYKFSKYKPSVVVVDQNKKIIKSTIYMQ